MKEDRYSNTETYDLLSRHTIEEVRKAHYEHGMYKAAEILDTSFSIIRYLALKHGWKRPLPPHLMKAYKLGRWNNMKTNFIPNDQL